MPLNLGKDRRLARNGGRFCRIDLGGRRAFAGSPRWAEGWPSGLAGAPKVASAPRGPGSAPLAGNLVQSLPRAGSGALRIQPILMNLGFEFQICTPFLLNLCPMKPSLHFKEIEIGLNVKPPPRPFRLCGPASAQSLSHVLISTPMA